MNTSVIDNRTLVNEEKLGYASHYLVQHETSIQDPAVRKQIAQMALEEVVS